MQYEDSQESVLQCPASRQIAQCSQRPRRPGGADRAGGRSTVLNAAIDMRIGHQLVDYFIGEEQKLPCIAAKVGGTCSKRADPSNMCMLGQSPLDDTDALSPHFRGRGGTYVLDLVVVTPFGKRIVGRAIPPARFQFPGGGLFSACLGLREAGGGDLSSDFTLLAVVMSLKSKFLNAM